MKGMRRRLEQRIILGAALTLELALIALIALKGDFDSFEKRFGWPVLPVSSVALFFLYILYVELRVTRSARAIERSEAFYQSLVETLPQYVFRKDLEGRVRFINYRFCSLLGKSPEEILGKTSREVLPLELSEWTLRSEPRVWGSGEPVEGVVEIEAPGGQKTFYQVIETPVFDSKRNIIGAQAIFWDITSQRQAELALRKSEERYTLAVQGAKDGIWDWDFSNGQVYYSPRWKEMLGFQEGELSASPEEWLSRVHPEDLGLLKAAMASHALGHVPHFEYEYRIQGKDGTYRWMLSRGIAVRDGRGQVSRIAGSQTDIGDRKCAEEKLLHQALYDALTDLPNRTLFMDRLRQALRRNKRSKGKTCSVLFLDLDRFKEINDSLGHAKGDQLLVSFARRLEKSVRPGDTIARLGGDEFTVLLEDLAGLEGAVHVAERIRNEFTSPFVLGTQELFVTVSIGIAPGNDYDRPEDLLRDADTAMYRAKERGRACFEVFDQGMHSLAVERLQTENELRRALERKEIRIHYQPVFSLSEDGLLGFEALVRWQHPRRGLLGPGEFLPLAEETGQVVDLDRWVLRQACGQARDWQRRFPQEPPIAVAVNLSGKHFLRLGLVAEVEEILRETGLEARSLILEITESVLLGETKLVQETVQGLKDLGARLSLDDFGTGYSSLSYLHRFPFDSLKIDRSFVQELGTGSAHGQMVRTIMSLAHSLNLGVVAEGVETQDQLRHLRAMRCEQVQGYFLSKPMPVEEAEGLLSARAHALKS
jgi:diguanylate cyclase (GGDEF)-like protein/PAS domain S-box-containing protein